VIRVALVNPPAARPVLRDYYCSTRPKAAYFWHPVDLLVLATRLRGRAELLVLDAVGERLDAATARQRIEAFGPDAVFGLASTLTTSDDLAFLTSLPGRLVVGGEVAQDAAFPFDAHPGVDALAPDFVAPELADHLVGGPLTGRIRARDHAPTAPARGETYALGGPLAHDLLRSRVRLPLWGAGFASLLTDYGCPHTCAFCNSGAHVLGYRRRDLDEVRSDVAALAAGGTRRVYLRDMTFGWHPEHAEAVFDALAPHDFAVRAFLRAEQITPTFADGLARAGFELVQVGIESGDGDWRRRLGKPARDETLARAAALLRERGIALGAHFVVGFAGEPKRAALGCASLARRLGAAYCSINVYAPRRGCAPLDALPPSAARRVQRSATLAMLGYNGVGFAARAARRVLPSRALR